MYAWLIGRAIRSLYRKIQAGRPEAVAALASGSVKLVVPGTSSLAGTYRGKARYESWLRQFTALGPAMVVHDVVVSGWPWNTRVAVRLTESVGSEYRNDCVDYLRLRWGKLRYHQLYLDTAVLDRWERSQPSLVGSNPPAVPIASISRVSAGSPSA